MIRVVRYFWLALFSMSVAQSWADAVLIVGEEALQGETGRSETFVSEAASTQTGSQWELVNQLDLLQQEVQMLRGIVEEQSYQLDRMQKTDRDRYIDLDRRISGLREQFSTIQSSLSSANAASPAVPEVEPEPVEIAPKNVSFAPEKELYDRAQGYVQSRKFDLAIVSFKNMLEKYPDGDYVPYGHYWLGEVYMALDIPLMDDAKKHFLVVLAEHAKHPKVPASLFKLGKLYDLSGDPEKAMQYFDRVITDHPSSSSASLADRYKQKWQSQEPSG